MLKIDKSGILLCWTSSRNHLAEVHCCSEAQFKLGVGPLCSAEQTTLPMSFLLSASNTCLSSAFLLLLPDFPSRCLLLPLSCPFLCSFRPFSCLFPLKLIENRFSRGEEHNACCRNQYSARRPCTYQPTVGRSCGLELQDFRFSRWKPQFQVSGATFSHT